MNNEIIMTQQQHDNVNANNACINIGDDTHTSIESTVAYELQEQMIELQMGMAHLELTVERLDEVITKQDQHIRTLQRQLQLIYKQMESQSADVGIAPFDVMADRPPHY